MDAGPTGCAVAASHQHKESNMSPAPNSQKPLPAMPPSVLSRQPVQLPTLMSIGGDMQALTELMYELGGDVSETSVDQAITKWMEENKANLAKKIDAYLFAIDEFYSRGEAQKAVAKKLRDQGQYAENAGDRLKARLKEFMLANAMDEIKGEVRRVALSKQSDRKTVRVVDEAQVPTQYLVATWTVDKKKVEADLIAGKEVAGCVLEPAARAFRVY